MDVTVEPGIYIPTEVVVEWKTISSLQHQIKSELLFLVNSMNFSTGFFLCT